MNRIFTASAILILPLTGVWAQSVGRDGGNGDETSADRAFDYISQVREQRESQTNPPAARQRQSRQEILSTVSSLFTTRDTARGVVVTVPQSEFVGGKLRSESDEKVAQVAAMVVAHPGTKVVVEGHTGSEDGEIAKAHAQAIREKLIDTGVDPDTARAVGYVKSPLAANAGNGVVEIVISGPAIGTLALSNSRSNSLTSSLR